MTTKASKISRSFRLDRFLALWPLISTPISRQTATAFSGGRFPSLAASPKLKQNTDSSSPFSSIIFRNIPSAIGLRQMLAVQTNTIFMIIVIPLCIQRAFRPPLFYQPLASYQVFPTLASATIGTVRETAPSISSVRIRAACSASSSGASTISSS